MYYTKEIIFIESLNRQAKLYIGLPDGYESSNKHYPVLYMHDGHNVFDPADSFLGQTWELIEAYLKDNTLPEIIVIGLECAPGLDRLDEYSPYEFSIQHGLERQVGGKGNVYLDYLVNDLKPKIDANLRTLKDANHTAIMGSSMGGVISLFAYIYYPHIFSRIASLSGAFYVSFNKYMEAIKQTDFQYIQKLYLDCGTDETEGGRESDFVKANQHVYQVLKEQLKPEQLKYELIEAARHTESEWAKRLPTVLKYLFS